MKKGINSNRIIVFAVFSVILFVLILLRLYDLQFIQRAKHKEECARQHIKKFILERKRGAILDRNHNVMAISLKVSSIFIAPNQIKDPQLVARTLSEHLDGVTESEVLEKIKKYKYFAWIKRKVEPHIAEKIMELELPGVYLQPEYKRYYPRGRCAANLLGFVGLDGKGLEGVEYYYDDVLSGVSGYEEYKADIRGYEIPQSNKKVTEPSGGYDLVLTIDEVVQYILEEELRKVFDKFQARSAIGIVMNPHNGDILALSNLPDFDPSKFNQVSCQQRKNRAITDIFEPGSTLKIVTALAALEEKLVKPSDTFFCDSDIKIEKFHIRCHAAHGELTLEDVIAQSCNVGMVQIAFRLGKQKLHEYLKKFGFGAKTGIGLPGESAGRLIPYKKWADIDLGAISFGQAIGTTAIQLVSAISAVFNDGLLLQPKFVKKIISPYSAKVVREFPEKVVRRRVISADTAKTMRKIMRKVVEAGTGRRAYLEGYDIAGKTGTAQKIDETGTYSKTKFVTSFIGAVPAENSKFVILLVIDEPRGERASGGLVAAEPFRRIAERLLVYSNIEPKEKVATDRSEKEETGIKYMVSVPNFTGMSRREAESLCRANNFRVKSGGKGNVVVFQYPPAQTPIFFDSPITLYFGEKNPNKSKVCTADPKVSRQVMPCLVGKSMREAMGILNNLKIKSTFIGSGVSYAQYPYPGESLSEVDEIRIFFGNKDRERLN